MYLTRTFGRWQVELHQRAIYVTRQPKANPNCLDCGGRGGHGWVDENDSADWEDCHCVSWLRTWRLPLWPRRINTREEYPF